MKNAMTPDDAMKVLGSLRKLYDARCVCGKHGLLLAARDQHDASKRLRACGWSRKRAGWVHPDCKASQSPCKEGGSET